jgi:biopolymer transport protein TolR
MRRPRRAMSEINVVPYIDVMLVLLIIFMVAAPLINPGQIDLPSVGQKLNATVAPLEIQVHANGDIKIVDRTRTPPYERRLGEPQLLQIVRDAQAANAEQAVVISADRKVAYGDVLRVLDTLKQGGIERVGLLARPAS